MAIATMKKGQAVDGLPFERRQARKKQASQKVSFNWEGVAPVILIPQKKLDERMAKVKKDLDGRIMPGKFGRANAKVVPTLKPEEKGNGELEKAKAWIPQKLLGDNGALYSKARLVLRLSEFGGKHPQNRIARIVCDGNGDPLQPIFIPRKPQRRPADEIAVFQRRPGESACVVTINNERTVTVHELFITREMNCVTVKAEPLHGPRMPEDELWRTLRFNLAVRSALSKFNCDGERFNPEKNGCMESHFLDLSGWSRNA